MINKIKIEQVIDTNLPDNNKQEITAEKLRDTLNVLVYEIDDSLQTLEDELDSIPGHDISGLEKKVDQLSGQVTYHDLKLQDISDDLEQFETDLELQGTELESLDKITNSILSDVEDLGTKVKNAEGAISGLQETVSGFEDEIKDAQPIQKYKQLSRGSFEFEEEPIIDYYIEGGYVYYNEENSLVLKYYINFDEKHPETVIISTQPIEWNRNSFKCQKGIDDLWTDTGLYCYVIRYVQTKNSFILLVNGSIYE